MTSYFFVEMKKTAALRLSAKPVTGPLFYNYNNVKITS